MGVSCSICGAETETTGYLATCQNKVCGGVHWDKGKIKTIKKALKADPELLKQVLNDANVPGIHNAAQKVFFCIWASVIDYSKFYLGLYGCRFFVISINPYPPLQLVVPSFPLKLMGYDLLRIVVPVHRLNRHQIQSQSDDL